MASSELPIRFSDEIYATKQEVSRHLGTGLIDSIWTKILEYRSHFTRVLSLRSIEKSNLNVVLTPTLLARSTAAEHKMFIKVMVPYIKMDDRDPIKRKISLDNEAKILYWVAKKYNLTVSEGFLHAIIRKQISAISPEQMILQRYHDALTHLATHYADPIDENFFAEMYSILTGNPELVTLYRQEEVEEIGPKAVIGRLYNAAPVERLPEMMENFLDFVKTSDLSTFVKAAIAYYFMLYVKPFDVHSEEMALLTAKNILAHGDFNDLAAILDLESLLSFNQDQLSKILIEVQRTGDLTYFLVYFLDLLESIGDDLLDRLQNLQMTGVKEEFYASDKPAPEKPAMNKPVIPESQPALKAEIKAAPTVVAESRQAPAGDPAGQADPAEAPVPAFESVPSPVTFEMKVALPTMPVGLDEKDAARIEENLLEMNPKLKRGEAYFYARHCTIGKYYTIAQYKKVLNCAYETARTSMDHLVYEGYYRKEMLKNKFIYTPIPRR